MKKQKRQMINFLPERKYWEVHYHKDEYGIMTKKQKRWHKNYFICDNFTSRKYNVWIGANEYNYDCFTCEKNRARYFLINMSLEKDWELRVCVDCLKKMWEKEQKPIKQEPKTQEYIQLSFF